VVWLVALNTDILRKIDMEMIDANIRAVGWRIALNTEWSKRMQMILLIKIHYLMAKDLYSKHNVPF